MLPAASPDAVWSQRLLELRASPITLWKDLMAMDMKSIGTILAGATILYAGILTLADDLYVGVGMVMAGGVIAALPIWRAMWKPAASPGKFPTKGKRKTHLKVVDEHDKHPTYH